MARTGVWRKRRRNLRRRNHPWMVFAAALFAIAIIWAVALRGRYTMSDLAGIIERIVVGPTAGGGRGGTLSGKAAVQQDEEAAVAEVPAGDAIAAAYDDDGNRCAATEDGGDACSAMDAVD